MIKGVHGFHVYATEYWTDYLLAAAAVTDGLDESSHLFTLVVLLAQKPQERSDGVAFSAADSDVIDERLLFIRQHEVLYRKVKASMISRSRKALDIDIMGRTSKSISIYQQNTIKRFLMHFADHARWRQKSGTGRQRRNIYDACFLSTSRGTITESRFISGSFF
jgi:hypothetical protein